MKFESSDNPAAPPMVYPDSAPSLSSDEYKMLQKFKKKYVKDASTEKHMIEALNESLDMKPYMKSVRSIAKKYKKQKDRDFIIKYALTIRVGENEFSEDLLNLYKVGSAIHRFLGKSINWLSPLTNLI
ncbi:MAG: hypothetical protein ACOCQD_05475 [archaeon]